MEKIPRRQFLKNLALFLGPVFIPQIFPKRVFSQVIQVLPSEKPPSRRPIVSVVKGEDKKKMLAKVLQPFGGIGNFVKSSNRVVIKPNAAWERTPDEAATTHPELVRGMIELCYEAGAGEVTVVENTCDNFKSAFKVTGMNDAVKGTKAKLKALENKSDFEEIDIPKGEILKKAAVAKNVLGADVFINMPIAKVHSASKLTIGMKNHMGAVEDRGYFHLHGLNRCIADISTVLRPNLIVIDATRILLTNGPKGPGKVAAPNQVIAGTDQVACDSFAAGLFSMSGYDVEHIVEASKRGLGEIDLNKVDIRRANL
ncbi:MAG: DUF362 domain-containing protein [Candidatus Omnitrophica bacterium]|nr:DUF362 domain-containing protein [Candidatus Omnitrophota bacterium]